MLGPEVPGRLLRMPHGDPALHWLLGALGLLVFVGEPLRSLGVIGGWPQALLLATTLMVGLLGLKSPTRLAWPILLLGPLVIVALALTDHRSPTSWRIAGGSIAALALAMLAAALLRQVLADGQVTVARIEGAVAL